MYIDREHYLQLLRKCDLLQQQNQILEAENVILARELERQKVANFQLMNRFEQAENYATCLNEKVINQSSALHCDLKGTIMQTNQQQLKYLQNQFQALETSAFQKYKLLEIKNTANRIQNHEMLDFVNKIKKIFKNIEHGNQQPSMKELWKWIKLLASHSQQNIQSVVKDISETGTSWKENQRHKAKDK